ncbi:MAG: HEAT repeat domain-containing protein [Promethearchaeota archaeon]
MVVWILKALGEIGGEEVLPLLGQGLQHEYWRVRRVAARVLGNSGDAAGALPILRAAELGETDRHVLAEIRGAIRKLTLGAQENKN